VVGILSDFKDENEFNGGELLNLTARRQQPYRILDKTKPVSLSGLLAIVYADADPPAPGMRRQLMDFVRGGGLLLAGKSWPELEGTIVPYPNARVTMRACGKGRLAIEDLDDPFQTAFDAQLLLSHANDLVKVYNAASSGCTLVMGSPDGKRALVQVLSYATGRVSGARTVWVRQHYRSARVWSIGTEEPVSMEPAPADEYVGVECPIPAAVPGYFALEFEV